MKRDYSTFVSLPQKTSLHISTPANIFKKIMYYKCMMVKNIQNYLSTIQVEQICVTSFFKLKVTSDVHSIFKYC